MKKEEEEEEEADSHTEKKHNKNDLNMVDMDIAEDVCDNATNNGTTTIEGKSFEVPSNGTGFDGNFERLFDSD
jgi:predicted secreted acid phosphatase